MGGYRGHRVRGGGVQGNDMMQADPVGLYAGVRMEGLTKQYGNGKVAVQGLTLSMYQGQVTCLLGHNGAGKSTVMAVLTGLHEPTEGVAYLAGHSVRANMSHCRASMGLCPQANTLFDALTVTEQLRFFAAIKGSRVLSKSFFRGII